MAGNDVDLKISAVVGDSTELKKLAAEIEAMGGDAAETSAEADALNKALEQLGQKQTAIDAFKKQKNALDESAQAMQSAQAKAQELGKALSETENASKKQTAEFEKARKNARETGEAYDQQRLAIQNSRAALQQMGVATTNLAAAQVEINRSTDEITASQAELVVSTRERVAQTRATVTAEEQAAQAAKERAAAEEQAAAEAIAAERSREQAIVASAAAQQKAFQDIAVGYAKVAAVGAPFVASVKSAVEFETAMVNVAKVVDGTDAQMEALASRIKVLSTELPISAIELAKMAEAGGQLGVPLEKLEQFILLAAKMGTAFNISADEAGQAVAKLSNVFNLPLESVASLGDAINLLGNTTAARESDIIDVLTRVGGAAVQFGLTAEQVSALAATMLSLGLTSEVAGTGINAMLTKLQTANVQGKEFQEAMARMGVSANQLAADIRANPQQALSKFLSTLKDLDGQARAEIVTKLFGLEYQDDIARMVGSLDQYQAALGKVGDKANYAGAMQSEFDKRASTTEAQLKRLENSINTVSINLGSIFLPAVNASADSMAGLTASLAEFIQQNPALAGMAASIGAVGVAGDGLLQVMTGLNQAGVTSFSQIGDAIQFVQQDVTALAGASSTAADKIAAAGAIAAAGWIGWNIGTALKEQFIEVETFGIDTAQVMTDLAARIQYTFDILKTPIDGNTFEAIAQRSRELDAELKNIETEYGALREAAIKAREPMVEAPKAAAVAIDAMTQELDAAIAAERQLEVAAKQAGEKAAQAAKEAEEEYRKMGVTSLKSLQDSAKAAEDFYNKLVKNKAPIFEQRQAWEKYVEATLKAASAQGAASAGAAAQALKAKAATQEQAAAVDALAKKIGVETQAVYGSAAAYRAKAEALRLTNPGLAQVYDRISATADANEKGAVAAGENAQQTQNLGEAADGASTSVQTVGVAIGGTTTITQKMVEEIDLAIEKISQLSTVAGEVVTAMKNSGDTFTEWTSKVAGLNAADFANEDNPLIKLRLELGKLGAQADESGNAITELNEKAQFASPSWKPWYDGLKAIATFENGLASAKIEVQNTKIATEEMNAELARIKDAADSGTITLVEQSRRLNTLHDQYRGLDNTSLSGLRSEIQSVTGEIESAIDAAKALEASLLKEQARQRGDDVTAVQLENTEKIADIQDKIDEARKAGNTEALAILQNSLAIQQRLATEAEREARAKTESAKAEQTRRANEPTKPATAQQAPAVDTKAITEAIKSAQAGTPTVTVYLDSKQIAKHVQIAINDNIRRGLN